MASFIMLESIIEWILTEMVHVLHPRKQSPKETTLARWLPLCCAMWTIAFLVLALTVWSGYGFEWWLPSISLIATVVVVIWRFSKH